MAPPEPAVGFNGIAWDPGTYAWSRSSADACRSLATCWMFVCAVLSCAADSRGTGSPGPPRLTAMTSWLVARFPGPVGLSAAEALMAIVAASPTAMVIAPRAAPDRAWYRTRSRKAGVTAIGDRRPAVA